MKAATEFGRRLLDAARPRGVPGDAFLDGLEAHRLPLAAIRGFAVSVYGLAVVFPRRLAAVLSLCDDERVRRSVTGNLLEEEGVASFQPGQGLRVDPSRSHPAMARRFALAAGATADDLAASAARLKEGRWFGDAIHAGDWLGAFAYFAVGHEANVPAACARLAPPLLSHYGFTPHEIEFVTEHATADERHGIESADLIASIAVEPQAQARALEGARRGGQGWHALLRRCASAGAVPA